MFRFLQRWRLRRASAQPLSSEQLRVLRELPFVRRMPKEDRSRFYEHVCVFLREKRFEGVGIDVTDEMRLVVAAGAARLSRNVGFAIYDRLDSVVIYPHTFLVPSSQAGPLGWDVEEQASETLGQHHPFGTVVLSWAAVKEGLRDPHDGHDVILHELAHVIDAADGGHDGTPPLGRQRRREWAEVFSRHFLALQEHPDGGFLDAYAAKNEAEFFAVATEAFFEKPRAMRAWAPDLYAALQSYYRVDPAAEGSSPSRRGAGG